MRAYDFGEGDYATMEANIRMLLQANGASNLPPATDVPNKTPTAQLSPESYLGYNEIQYDVGTPIAKDQPTIYHAPANIPRGRVRLQRRLDRPPGGGHGRQQRRHRHQLLR